MIRLYKTSDIPYCKAIYKAHKWTRYLDNDTTFNTMFKHSLATYVYEENTTIKGLVRVVGDNTHILYIQDLLVHPNFLRQGIGRQLITHLLQTYPHIRQKVLVTDKTDDTANAFYQSLGFTQANKANVTCYVHFS